MAGLTGGLVLQSCHQMHDIAAALTLWANGSFRVLGRLESKVPVHISQWS